MALPDTLDAWLAYVESLHHRPIDMGLERIRAVAGRLDMGGDVLRGARRIVVGGTNGKGSTCAMLDAILHAADQGAFRKMQQVPHFAAVERARADVSLTYFEFTTLVVLSWFAAERVDVAILEVGLGGRLDAVNIVDADCAVVTTIDLDHVEMLGPTREHIGWEKAHIFRAGRPAICVDPDPPESLLQHARTLGADLWRLGHEFSLSLPAPGLRQWNYHGRRASRMALPWPALRGAHQLRNAAGVLAALEALADVLPVDQGAVRKGLGGVHLTGRFQIVPGKPAIVLDVAHNPHAAQALADALRSHATVPDGAASPGPRPRTHAIFGMLRDKDAAAVAAALQGVIDDWHFVPTTGERGRTAAALAQAVSASVQAAPAPASAPSSGSTAVVDGASGPAGIQHESVCTALRQLQATVAPDDRIVVFGSFVIVAEALRCLERGSQ